MRLSYLPVVERLEWLQRKVIVHSIIYYELNGSVITDAEFDKLSRGLARLSKKHPDEWRQTMYYYCMHDFDGTTGFDLYGRLADGDKRRLLHIAQHVMRLKRGG